MSDDFQPRSRSTHIHHCSQLNGPLHDHIVTTYGVKKDSILNTSKYFHVTDGLAPDIMHDILEGVLMYETKELLKYYILEKKIFSLAELNRRIDYFPYRHSDAVNKPTTIKIQTLTKNDHALKLSGKTIYYCNYYNNY